MASTQPSAYDEVSDDDVETRGVATWREPWVVAVGERRPDHSYGIERELRLVASMRSETFTVAPEQVDAKGLVWRLMAATSLATGILSAGLVLTLIGLIGASIRPNLYVALSVLLVGVALVATLVKTVRDG